jgi:hypothetical protein
VRDRFSVKEFREGIENVLGSKYFLIGALAWFGLQAILIALTIDLYIPPDEGTHTTFIVYLVEHGFDPLFVDQSSKFVIGDIEREVSYLYHWIMSPFYAVFEVISSKPLYLLRFVNILFGLGSLIVLKKIGDQLRIPKFVTHFSVFAMGSTLMFVFLSAGTNYDNLAVLVSLASFLVLIRLLQKFSLWRLLVLATLIIFGSLIKYTFWPLAIFFITVAGWQVFRERAQLGKHWRKFLKHQRWQAIVMTIIFLALAGLGIERVGGNLIMYGDPMPPCDAIHSVAECQNYSIYSRKQNLAEKDINEKQMMNLVEFAPRWVMGNVPAIFGIYAHKMLTLPDRLTMPIVTLFAFALMATIRKVDIKRNPMLALLTLAIAGYLAIVMLNNFNVAYENSGHFSHALQGRYTFPVLPLMYLIGFNYIHKLIPRYSVYVFVTAVPLFVLAGAPALFALTDLNWYTDIGEKLFIHTDSIRVTIDWILRIIK